MNEITSLLEIKNGPLSDQTLFRKLIEQVEKDMRYSDMTTEDLDLSSPSCYFESVLNVLEKMILANPEKIRALLYRVDVNERLINEFMTSENQLEVIAKNVTKLLIIRELDKIQNRKKYEKD